MTSNTDRLTGWVYFIRSGDAIKIGFSVEPLLRIGHLQPGNQFKLELLAQVPTSVITERQAQEMFRHLHIRGEWFRAESSLLEYITKFKRPAAPEPTAIRKFRKQRQKPAATQEVLDLLALRAKHGGDSPIGHRCSNLMEQIEALGSSSEYQRAHIRQSMDRQMADLARLTA